MTTLTFYDPAMCFSTGLCGTEIDQKPVDLAADPDWLKAQGVTVRRVGLSAPESTCCFPRNAALAASACCGGGEAQPGMDKRGCC